MITLIAAISDNNVIGKKNDLPWKLPEDLLRFKQLTTGHPVIMGRKTYDSIIKRLGKPLPNRTNIIISRQLDLEAPEDVEVFNALEDAIAVYRSKDPFVIGGEQIYRLALPFADRLEITHVHKIIEGGDAFFPEIDPMVWKKSAEDKHPGFTFVTYSRM